MINLLQQVLERALDRLSQQITAILPGVLAGLAILLLALCARQTCAMAAGSSLQRNCA